MSERSKTVAVRVVYKAYTWKVGQAVKTPPVTVSSKHQKESGGDIGSIPILSMLRIRSTLDRSTAVAALSKTK